jgi:hypothetical protein
MYFSQLPSISPPLVDAVSSGDTRPASLTISHTTGSGSNRLMLVGISLVNDELETVSTVTYNGVSLTKVGEQDSVDDARVEIWSLVAPPTGTYDVVITFSAPLRRAAQAGVMTYTGVDQTTPLGTFASAFSQASSGTATVNVSSAAGELVFDTVACSNCSFLNSGSGQTERWNLTAMDVPRVRGRQHRGRRGVGHHVLGPGLLRTVGHRGRLDQARGGRRHRL